MLTTHEVTRLIVLILVIGLYVAAAVLIVSYATHRLMHPAVAGPPHGALFIWARRIIFALAGIGLLCFAWGYFVEPYRIEITHIKLTSAKLPRNARTLRFVQISDLHSEARPRLEERLPAIIAAQKPDFIIFTGDAVNSPKGLATFKRCISRVAAIAPTFAVKGNWDVWYEDAMDFFGDGPAIYSPTATGVHELKGEAVNVTAGGASVWVAGAGCWSRDDLLDAIGKIPQDAYSIVIYHHPNMVDEVAGLPVGKSGAGADLLCLGHTHGGQVALPWYGGLVKLDGAARPYERGLFRVKETWAYVNRGIGMEGSLFPRVRFFARPEVTVYELTPLAETHSASAN